MSGELLLTPQRLDELLRSRACIVVDCRFDFADPDKGRKDWRTGHIPGATYAHLGENLSSPVTDFSGRHPLPHADDFARFLASIGWARDKLLVAYDEGPNAVAARLWWLMRYFGQSASLLDGGLAAWEASGLPLESGTMTPALAPPATLQPDLSLTATAVEIQEKLDMPELLVLDARAAERFAGKVEPLDTRAGHIPGALNRHFGLNLGPGDYFKSPQELRTEFRAVLGAKDLRNVVHSCGSGVSACHNLFAMELSGLEGTRLYPGSWSEWIRDPSRPVASGD
ncbi:MAG: sulfurtransferase [Xanthomonadales bacterium]|nr:sulfurtransferase [Xanthomonadales bacterium]